MLVVWSTELGILYNNIGLAGVSRGSACFEAIYEHNVTS